MSALNEDQFDELVRKAIVIANKNCKNTLELGVILPALLKSSQGKTLKEKKTYLRERFIDAGTSYSYLCKLINKAELEINLLLEPGELLEYQARRILSEKDPSNQIWIHSRALELSGDKKLTSTYIEQAIEELKDSKNKTDKKTSSSTSDKSTVKKKSSSKDTGNGVTNDTSLNFDGGESHLNDNDELPFKWESTVDIYKEIKPNIKSIDDKTLLIKVINASTEFWKVLKILLDAKLSDKYAKELVDLIRPNNSHQKGSVAKKSNSRNASKNKRPGNSPRA